MLESLKQRWYVPFDRHNSKARYSRIAGLEHFKGRVFHSHNYREPAPFRGQRVLIIGAGPSGIDMGFDLSSVTDTVCHATIHNFIIN